MLVVVVFPTLDVFGDCHYKKIHPYYSLYYYYYYDVVVDDDDDGYYFRGRDCSSSAPWYVKIKTRKRNVLCRSLLTGEMTGGIALLDRASY